MTVGGRWRVCLETNLRPKRKSRLRTTFELDYGQPGFKKRIFRTPDVVEFGMSPFSWRRHSCLLGRDSGLLISWN
jgi:hypothetical protein